jgi:Signal transduction histidine kinase
MNYIFYLILLLCPIVGLTGQEIYADSLETILNSDTADRDKAIAAISLSSYFLSRDLDKVPSYARRANQLLPRPDSLKVQALDQLARYYFFKSNLDSALFYFQAAQSTADQISNPYLHASLGNSIASVYIRQSKYQEALTTLVASADYFESTSDESNASKCYSNMSAAHAALGNYAQAIKYSKDALVIFRKNGLDQYTLITLPNLATQYLESGDTTQAIAIFLQAEELALEKENKRSLALTYNNLGDLYLTHRQYAKAQVYIEKSIAAKEELKLLKGIDNNYHNLGYVYAQQDQHDKALDYYTKAIELADPSNKVAIYNKMNKSYLEIGKVRKALSYANLSIALNDSLSQVNNTQQFAEISAKYETAKKENEILRLESDNQRLELVKNRDRAGLLGAIALLVALSVLSFLYLKGQRRKQLITKQRHELEQKNLLEELNRTELESIDRMISGQEEERNRISADLHDSLGSKMAALKLFVDDLDQQSPKNKNLNHVREIADHAYKEVRNMSHLLNSGVLTKRGLIPAIKNAASFIADTKHINIEVIDLDMPDRIDNAKEIQLFRITQELLTNIVKHANASEATVQLVGDSDEISLSVEDNGTGFDHMSNGIGLSSVESRVSNLGGVYEIDASMGKGTSVMIKIPI